jgi:hypothetical protein
MVFTLLPQSVGIMEWWSNGVMKGQTQVGIGPFAFVNTPILQYFSTPKQLSIYTGKTIELRPGPKDQVMSSARTKS